MRKPRYTDEQIEAKLDEMNREYKADLESRLINQDVKAYNEVSYHLDDEDYQNIILLSLGSSTEETRVNVFSECRDRICERATKEAITFNMAKEALEQPYLDTRIEQQEASGF